MKKMVAAFLVFAMVIALRATVFAEETVTEDTNVHGVLASYETDTQNAAVINVDISWEDMSFTYKDASAPEWDAEKHRYEVKEEKAGWAEGNGTITIRNNSNAMLQALIKYEPEEKFETVSMSFTDVAPYLGSAYTDDRVNEAGETVGTPCEVIIKALPVGILPKGTEANTTIGMITISLDSEVDAYDMLDELALEVERRKVENPESLERGDAYFISGTQTDQIYLLLDEAAVAIADSNKTDAQKNVAINKALTAFYSALNIAQ